MNRRLASGSVRSRSTRRMFWVISRKVAGMDVEVVLLRHMEQAQDRHRILGEGVGRGDGQPLAVEAEAVELARPQGLPQGGELGLAAAAVLERRDEDAREVADRLGMQVVVLGETLDAAAARPVLVAEPRGDLALQVERQAVVGAAGEIVDVAAHGGEEALGALEMARLVLGEHALGDQLAGLAARDRDTRRSRTAGAGRAARPCPP